jgi:hypothetical protein
MTTANRVQLWDQRGAALDAEYSSWLSHYRELNTFLMPRAGLFLPTERNRGDRRHNAIHDNTGMRAVRIGGAGMMSGASSPARPWVRFLTNRPEANRRYAVTRWLDDVTEIVLQTLAKSNAYRVLHGMYEELFAYGTAACLFTLDAENVIHLQPFTVGEYRLACDHKGVVNTCYRTFALTVAELVGQFGLDRVSARVRDLHANNALQQPVKVRHVVEPRRDRAPGATDNRSMPWTSVYYEVGINEDRVLYESGFEEFPVLAPRWGLTAGDVYGHCPGMEALGDIKQLQHQQLRKGQGIDFQTMPPMLAPSTMKGQESRWAPGGIVFYDGTAPAAIKSAFEVPLRLDYLLTDIQDVRERIRGSFFADLFLMLAQADKRMTATEVAERHEEKLIQLGPVLERLHNELLAPLVKRTYRALRDIGALPPPPPELETLNLVLEFTSTLAQAQRAVGLSAIERSLAVAGAAAQFAPDIVDNLDPDALWTEINSMLGVTSRISRDPRKRDELRQAKIAAQSAQAQAALAQQTSVAAKNVATASPDSGALRDVMSLFSGYEHPAPQTY